MPGPQEIIIIAVIGILIFGSRKLPEAARSLGRSMRIFKSEVKQLNDDDQGAATTNTVAAEVVQPTAEIEKPATEGTQKPADNQ